jgi:predicted helicase
MLNVFREDRLYKNRFDKMWTWKQWADENNIRDTHGTSHDLGIDIVARERVGGELCAVQCKCHADDTELGMKPVNSFISAGTSYGMKNYILACTGPINRNARAKLRGVKCGIITKEDLRYRLDWGMYPGIPKPLPPKKLRDYQEAAFEDVVSGFSKNDRGKMIMACGTGKTLVSLHVAEKIAKKGGLVLYLVPSISLILQAMREWSDNANIKHYYMAVCSDKSVRNTEQGTLTELEAPASTDPKDLAARLASTQDNALNVVFSTYHSIDVVSKAMGDRRFDIVFCDEAHRTTGIEKDSGNSYYTKVHYEDYIGSKRRLYMTATPRIYTENIKGKAMEEQKEIISMDDESIFGPEFHNLTFYDAVHRYSALCDFKVRVAVMDSDTMDKMMQQLQAGEENHVPINEKSLMASVWHAIQHPGADDTKSLLQRVIFFADMINSSKIIAGDEIRYNVDYRDDPKKLEHAKNVDAQRSFERLVGHINEVFDQSENKNTVDVKHVDGADNAEYRKNRLEWLKNSQDDPNVCRILSNARCLSEGVDVPALDGIVFLNPRKSVVDVVQAVGRVMRKSEGKEYGYVVLPVVIPMGVSIDSALSDSKHFKIVWQVLNALRSHDPKLANEINHLILDHKNVTNEVTNRIIIRHAYSHDLDDADMPEKRMI